MRALLLVLVALLSVVIASADAANFTLIYNRTSQKYYFGKENNSIVDEVLAARATYDAAYTTTGWDQVYLEANAILTSSDSAVERSIAFGGVGYAEGYLTQQQIYNSYMNSVQSVFVSLTPAQAAWIQQQIDYVNATARANKEGVFYVELTKLWGVVEAMYAGYVDAAPQAQQLTFFQFYLNSFQAEVGDVQVILPATEQKLRNSNKFGQHCSALVKVTKDDIFLAHDTWSTYTTMIRQYKTYNLGGVTVSMSSYPGSLSSIDDWYITSYQLAVTETTNEIFNASLSKEYVKTNTIPEFLRVMIANTGASNGKDWSTLFATENSGTYCNQFMVVDMKLYNKGQQGADLQDNLLWVAEQLPGSVTSADVTKVLRDTSYWASYNIPYFPSVFAVSGNLAEEQEFGTFFSYTKYARPEIFRAHQDSVTDLDSMKAMMRYNNYTKDIQFSSIPNCSGVVNDTWCNNHTGNPMLSIASRGDLAPNGTNATLGPLWEFVNLNAFGAVDTKIASWSGFQNNTLRGVVICGPTQSNGLPAFQWTTSPFADQFPSLLGMSDLFAFPFVEMNVPYTPSSSPSAPSKSSKSAGIIIGVVVAAVVLLGIGAFLYSKKSESGSTDEGKSFV